MAVALGTNSGFVTVSPTADPGGSGTQLETRTKTMVDTSPVTAARITQVGWWCGEATDEANFEIGVYSADGAVVPGEAGTLLHVSRTNAKGTTSGWKKVTVDWAISGNTNYWLAVQLDTVAQPTRIDLATTGGNGYDSLTSQTTLNDPLGGGALSQSAGMMSAYMLWEAAPETSTGNMLLAL